VKGGLKRENQLVPAIVATTCKNQSHRRISPRALFRIVLCLLVFVQYGIVSGSAAINATDTLCTLSGLMSGLKAPLAIVWCSLVIHSIPDSKPLLSYVHVSLLVAHFRIVVFAAHEAAFTEIGQIGRSRLSRSFRLRFGGSSLFRRILLILLSSVLRLRLIGIGNKGLSSRTLSRLVRRRFRLI
jgi:hypothetical protein